MQIWQKGNKTSNTKDYSTKEPKQENNSLLIPPLTDTDYEFLFSQLLEGVAHGWHQGRIVKFFEQLGDRGGQNLWISWLERFGKKIMSSNAPNHQLAVRMIRLGQMSNGLASVEKIGTIAADIGQQWLNKYAGIAVWEYDGPDVDLTNLTNSVTTEQISNSTDIPLVSEQQVQTITLEELFGMLQQDSALVAQLAGQLEIETEDPQVIIQTLMERASIANTEETTSLMVSEEKESEENSQLNQDPVQQLFVQGLQQADGGDMLAAIASWDRALELNPNLSSGWHNRGSALGYLGRFTEAVESFDRAVALKPKDYQAWNDRGNALYNLQQWSEAIESWEQVLTIKPDYFQAWYNRGCALENLGELNKAIDSYRKVLEINPEFQIAKARLNNLLS